MSTETTTGASGDLALVLGQLIAECKGDRNALAALGDKLVGAGKQLRGVAPKLVFPVPGYERLASELVASSNGALVLGEEERKRFKDSKGWQRYKTLIKGRDVVIIGSTMTDTNQMEMYKLGYNAWLWKADSLTMVVTYHGDARQERAQMRGESVDGLFTSVQLAKIPQCRNGNEVLLVDIHDNTITGFFLGAGIRCRNIDILPKLIRYVGESAFAGKKCLAAAPDAGRGKLVWKAAKALGWEFAIANKFRSSTSGSTETAGLVGNVRGRNVILADDIGNSLTSVMDAGRLLLKKRAKRIAALFTHPATTIEYVRNCLDSGVFEAIFITDSLNGAYDLAAEFPGRVHLIPLAPLLAPDLLD